MFQLVRYLKQFKKQVILGPLFKLTEAIFELIVPLVMASIIDVGVKNGDSAYVLRMGGVMAVSYTHLTPGRLLSAIPKDRPEQSLRYRNQTTGRRKFSQRERTYVFLPSGSWRQKR